ncbi:glycosyltransferase family 2 protein [Falsiroseomonas sp. E2-1-a4]|uniref:glycosyltransferase family 2 protein n=1 Tax=Falsiroseomonas sp. E2-1-a4 TaxID=3239299 RepID=UPI003F2D1B82
MMFTVVIPTRNRPALFQQALDSVLMQQGVELEVIVINDGSDAEHEAAYGAIMDSVASSPVRLHHLMRQPRGHGQSYALNTGGRLGRGAYLCFLDDDDVWTDAGHLQRVEQAVRFNDPVDLYLADQVAMREGVVLPGPVWIEDLLKKVPDLPAPDAAGTIAVQPAQLLRAHGFCHLNTLVIRREFFLELGGLDEGLRYECDRDFYLRAIDRAVVIRYAPFNVSQHHVPIPSKGANMSTIMTTVEKRLSQLKLLDRAILSAVRPEIRYYARQHKAFTLQKISHEAASAGDHMTAAIYAREALAVRPSIGWLARTALATAQSALRSRPGA